MAKGRPRKLPKMDSIVEPNLVDLSEEEENFEEEEETIDEELDFDKQRFDSDFYVNDDE
jgi:hypothetical protein